MNAADFPENYPYATFAALPPAKFILLLGVIEHLLYFVSSICRQVSVGTQAPVESINLITPQFFCGAGACHLC
jgi:hypothetical protein